MRIDVLTLFPDMFRGPFSESMLKRAQENGLLEIALHDIRAWADNKHSKADDYPFGGGAGLVMMAQPIFDAVAAVDPDHEARRILLTPRGRLLTTERARTLAKHPRLLLLCGHYEGVDERVMALMDEEISIGDYILTGGELPAMVLVDAVSRFVPGVLGSGESAEEESFSRSLLEYPQYTRPAEFRGMAVPEVLLSGHGANIAAWRQAQALEKTRENRPELLGTYGKYYENKGK
ncbi:MAG: tRNA (guanosine(37)-N1)-methyltransferase TrmD [Clostridia bacterium]|nr:tRNA (guanosine(37)-N1)-methyltransferase TrmD [Clostridia bacterium]MBQ3487474.1 tRNA (guanosine(37)-N1)-methyltransferase TrmD [Clostridia bacterium]MBQ3651624.1 tRNA (guanosine(37)-N1)-methyltransferase TrmD [Clostridia bacterium]MBQ6358247.1 tRNA (guanosine(37)-N1)-methyltransferase TrmD [Clostridia bacterium]MBQ9323291.1 tRNA (guanosine(37)-N1)-methyltransferase TrmD [Clostridia bacterium]